MIRKLSPETTGKIAAGEVIERPVNAVKELVENSIDAGATRIAIDIEDGGKVLIRVSDNGFGIPASELPDAVESYSTSKISSIDDLQNVRTLGFRGEALGSIRSVSKLSIKSRSADEDTGREMKWKGEELAVDQPVAINPGTTIEAADLFFNLPARRKFLSSGASEARRISGLLQGFALSHPEISITLRSGGKELLAYHASSLEERVEAVFGQSIFADLAYFENTEGLTRVYGYTSMPELTRGNRSMQHIFVNSRAIRDKMLSYALRQSYRSVIPADRFPVVLLKIEIPPDRIDINVHPTKSEIRFENEREVRHLVTSTVRNVIGGKTISFRDKVESVYRTIFPSVQGPVLPGEGVSAGLESGSPGTTGHLPNQEQRSDWLFQESPESLFEGTSEETAVSRSGRLYWQLHQTYIFIQIRGGLVIIDQHAAHERILYNRAKNNIEGENPTVQSMLFPATLELSAEEYETYEECVDLLPAIGFEVEPFGPRSVIVRGIPSGIKNWNDGRLLQDILGEKDLGKTGIELLLKSYACRAAIKAGDSLSAEEMESLTDQLFATEFPFTCPHGRPTMLRVEISDLERRFQRTVTRE